MCDDCEKLKKELKGKVLSDKDFFHSLLFEAGLLKKVSTPSEPNFKVDKNSGEGTPTDEEVHYREELLLLLAAIFPTITRIIKGNDDTTTKISKIDSLLADFRTKSGELADSTTSKTFKVAVVDANNTLQSIEKGIKNVNGDELRLTLIQNQQVSNIEDISNYLRGRLIQGMNINEINEIYNGNPDFDFINSAFNIAKNRLDTTGMFGYIESNKQGFLSALLIGEAIVGTLIADWQTMEDDHVCDYCIEMREGGPYLISEWPPEHDIPYPDRCWMTNIRLEGT